MTTLDLFDVTKDKAPTFDWTHYKPDLIGNIFLRTQNDASYIKEIREEALKRGRLDVAKACMRAIGRSKPFAILTNVELKLRMSYPGLLKHKSNLLAARQLVYKTFGLKKSLEF